MKNHQGPRCNPCRQTFQGLPGIRVVSVWDDPVGGWPVGSESVQVGGPMQPGSCVGGGEPGRPCLTYYLSHYIKVGGRTRTSSHFIALHRTSSHFIALHPTSSHFIALHPTSSHFIAPYHFVAVYPTSSHFIAPYHFVAVYVLYSLVLHCTP